MSGQVVGPLMHNFIRFVFRCLSTVAPKHAGNLAFWLFCRPTKASSVTPVQRAMITEAEKILQTAKVSMVPYGSTNDSAAGTVQTYTFEPELSIKGTVLLLHGWSSRATHMLAFVAPLLAQGQRVVLIDFPGHGQSSGRTFHLPLGVLAVHAVRDQLPVFDSVIAHSLGSAVATSLIAGSIEGYKAVPLKRLVLMSAPNSMPNIFRGFADMIGLSASARAVLNINVVRLSGNRLETFVGSEQIRKSSVPTLVLHDPEDKELPISEAHDLAQAGDMITIKEIQDVGHRRILYSPPAVQLATDFVHPSRWSDQLADDRAEPNPLSI